MGSAARRPPPDHSRPLEDCGPPQPPGREGVSRSRDRNRERVGCAHRGGGGGGCSREKLLAWKRGRLHRLLGRLKPIDDAGTGHCLQPHLHAPVSEHGFGALRHNERPDVANEQLALRRLAEELGRVSFRDEQVATAEPVEQMFPSVDLGRSCSPPRSASSEPRAPRSRRDREGLPQLERTLPKPSSGRGASVSLRAARLLGRGKPAGELLWRDPRQRHGSSRAQALSAGRSACHRL